uniref:Uncharacterized protein n=1 Tax=viral metagenome TaxID=1070528 RepID=A0A6M3LWU1_9ZZZZ
MKTLELIANIVLIILPTIMLLVGYYYGLKDGRKTLATDKGCKACGAKYGSTSVTNIKKMTL